MQKSKSNCSIFYMNSSLGIIMLVVYVDGIVITESDSKGISSLKSFLKVSHLLSPFFKPNFIQRT